MVRHTEGGRIRLHAGAAGAGAVGRGDCFVVNWVPQDHNESRAEAFPDEVGEAPVQVHGGRGAAEYGENAFQVQKLQLLAVIYGGL